MSPSIDSKEALHVLPIEITLSSIIHITIDFSTDASPFSRTTIHTSPRHVPSPSKETETTKPIDFVYFISEQTETETHLNALLLPPFKLFFWRRERTKEVSFLHFQGKMECFAIIHPATPNCCRLLEN